MSSCLELSVAAQHQLIVAERERGSTFDEGEITHPKPIKVIVEANTPYKQIKP